MSDTFPDRDTLLRMFEIQSTIKQCDERFRTMLMSGQISLSDAFHGVNALRGNQFSHHEVAVSPESFDFVLSKLRLREFDICHSLKQQTARSATAGETAVETVHDSDNSHTLQNSRKRTAIEFSGFGPE